MGLLRVFVLVIFKTQQLIHWFHVVLLLRLVVVFFAVIVFDRQEFLLWL